MPGDNLLFELEKEEDRCLRSASARRLGALPPQQIVAIARSSICREVRVIVGAQTGRIVKVVPLSPPGPSLDDR